MTSNQSSNIQNPVTIPENEDDDATLVLSTTLSSTNSLHSQENSPYPASPVSSQEAQHEHDEISSKRNIVPIICILLCVSFIMFMILIIIMINNIGVIYDKDISKLPKNYELSLKRLYSFNSRFDYVINGISTIDSLININNNSRQENFNNNSSTTNTTFVLAELISRSLIVIPPGWYEVQEFRYNTNGIFIRKVLTTKCHIEFTLSYVWSAPDVIIQFTTYPLSNSTQELSLQESMKYCKWKISWTLIMNGYIHKLCPKNLNISGSSNNKIASLFDSQGYEKVAYFKGWELFGFTFLSLDSTINYGYTTVPNPLKMMSR